MSQPTTTPRWLSWAAAGPWWLCLAPGLLLFAFAGKAFNIDDTQFVIHARLIAQKPWAPWDQLIFWDRHLSRLFDFAHPLLWQYVLAAVRALAGESEIALQSCTVTMAMVGLYAVRGLAKSMGVSPLAACALYAGSSTFLVNGTSVMPDVAMASLGLLSLHLLVRAVEEDRWGLALAAGVSVVGAFQCRFSALFLFPLFVVYPLARRRFVASAWLPIATAVLLAVLSQVWPYLQMGETHFAHALKLWSNPLDVKRVMEFGFMLSTQLGAQLPMTGLVLFAVGARNRLGLEIVLLACALATGAAAWLAKRDYLISALLFVWPVAALMLDAGLRLARGFARGFKASSAAEATSWVCSLGLCTITYATVSHAHVAAKYALVPLPFALLLMLDRLRSMHGLRAAIARVYLPVSVVACTALGCAVALSDMRWSNTYREFFASNEWKRVQPEHGKLFYNADWGFRYYADRAGLPMYVGVMAKGDRLLRAEQVAPVAPTQREPRLVVAVLPLSYDGPFAIMNRKAKAGFFSDDWGVFPFTPARHVADYVRVLEKR